MYFYIVEIFKVLLVNHKSYHQVLQMQMHLVLVFQSVTMTNGYMSELQTETRYMFTDTTVMQLLKLIPLLQMAMYLLLH